MTQRKYPMDDESQSSFVKTNLSYINQPTIPTMKSVNDKRKKLLKHLWDKTNVFGSILGVIIGIIVLIILVMMIVLIILRVSTMTIKEYATLFVICIVLLIAIVMNQSWMVSRFI